MDSQEVQIEQGMQVGPEKQPIGWMIVHRSTIGPDVCGLHDVEKITPRDHACSPVSPDQLLAEGALPTSFPDCTKHTLPVVREGRCVLVLSGGILALVGVVS